ncbi:hypothetical protein MPRM_10370 [Mycobacterium parmense]|uniref:Uncharacterized protein n=1 Tax=Mycobacterium parmense TaxID=185642 RepID=A0A7I7YPG2_9MYCO|nr:hypothetical protein MPRM_10370 [Mycobacterium parmense]
MRCAPPNVTFHSVRRTRLPWVCAPLFAGRMAGDVLLVGTSAWVVALAAASSYLDERMFATLIIVVIN